MTNVSRMMIVGALKMVSEVGITPICSAKKWPGVAMVNPIELDSPAVYNVVGA